MFITKIVFKMSLRTLINFLIEQNPIMFQQNKYLNVHVQNTKESTNKMLFITNFTNASDFLETLLPDCEICSFLSFEKLNSN